MGLVRKVSRDKATPDGESSIEEIAKKYNVNCSEGLSGAQAAEVLSRDGLNELYKPPKPTLLMLFLMQLTGFIIILLVIAAVASIGVNATGPKKDDWLSYTTGVAILVLVVINAGIAAWTERQAGGALDALAKMSQATIDVLRDGTQQTVATNSVVR